MKNLLALIVSFLIGLVTVTLFNNYRSDFSIKQSVKINNEIDINNKKNIKLLIYDTNVKVFTYYKSNIIDTATSKHNLIYIYESDN